MLFCQEVKFDGDLNAFNAYLLKDKRDFSFTRLKSNCS